MSVRLLRMLEPLRRAHFPVRYSFLATRGCSVRRFLSEDGQTTAEYALVLLAAAAVAIVLINWATGNSALTGLFNTIITKIAAQIP